MPSIKSSGTKATLFSLTFIGVLFIAANLRAPITALGPVLTQISESFHLSSAYAGLLNALPLLIFAVTSPLAPLLTRKISIEKVLLIALALIAVGCFIRSFCGLVGLWGGTLSLGLGIAIANVLVVPLIKRDFPDNAARCVGLYAATMAMTAALSSGIANPLSNLSNASWRMAIGIWVFPAALTLILWAKICLRSRDVAKPVAKPSIVKMRSIWKSRLAWQVSLFMAMQTLVFYTLIDWYPSMAKEHGIGSSTAGFHLFIYQIVAVVANLSTSAIIMRLKDQRLLGLVCSLFITLGIAGLLVQPAYSFLWLIFAGIGAGMSMVTCLTLFSLRTKDHSQAGQLSGKAQCVGYLIGALGPYLAGLLHAHSHTWHSTLLGLLCISLIQIYFSWQAGSNKFID